MQVQVLSLRPFQTGSSLTVRALGPDPSGCLFKSDLPDHLLARRLTERRMALNYAMRVRFLPRQPILIPR